MTGIEIPRDALLFYVDVDSLYTNIDNNSGIEAVKQAFLRNPVFDRPDVDILELLKISLEHNDFLFASNWYLQIFGTAMGKRFAPNYANLFMAEWEKQALTKFNKLPLIYLRYLDDIFGIWTHGDDEYRVFLDILNSHQNCVNLTSVTSKQSIDKSDFEEAVQILFHSLRQRNYTPRFLRHIKNTTLANIKNRNRKEQAAKCQVKRCQACTVFVDFTPNNNTKVTQRDKINNCGTSNVVHYNVFVLLIM